MFVIITWNTSTKPRLAGGIFSSLEFAETTIYDNEELFDDFYKIVDLKD